MPLSSDELAVFDRLSTELGAAQAKFDIADSYYDGMQNLEQLGLAIPPELLKFTVIVNWPRIAVDSVEERLDIKGFRAAGEESGDDELWRIWQANRMQEQFGLATLDYLIYGRTYVCVGTNADDETTPVLTVESPRHLITDRDPLGNVRAALRMYDVVNGLATKATLYLPNVTIHLSSEGFAWQEVDGEDGRDEHDLGAVPVVPIFNRRRTTIPRGRTLQGVSEMEDVIPLTDSAARNLTNAQVAQETHAVPARGVLGATKGDFVDQDGKPLPQWAAYFGSVWALSNKDAKTFQFDSSDMSNFERMVELYARQASAVSGLPASYFGLAADDAASADAIRSRETRLVRKAERKQVGLGNGAADVMRLVTHVRDGQPDPKLNGLESLWHDAATPTVAQKTDAVVKLYQSTDASGRPLLPARFVYEELGYTPQRIKRILAERDREVDPYLARLNDKDAADVDAEPAVVGD
ncbi:MAG: phage portal protein [Aeromicrobium sp.]|uniref:phage portal protein n=1 Tax=Aeromicrobium sp. TaxID=1871063 RepID=UPI00262347F0|nr:phage portal protein [Aeromicrobium sp.]MDF1705024.1 phage portal protein [Aeromicrobium sp.]